LSEAPILSNFAIMEIGLGKVLLLAGALQGLVLAILLFSRKVNVHANRILSAVLFILSIHIIIVAFDEKSFFMRFPHLSHISWLTPTLIGPTI